MALDEVNFFNGPIFRRIYQDILCRSIARTIDSALSFTLPRDEQTENPRGSSEFWCIYDVQLREETERGEGANVSLTRTNKPPGLCTFEC